MTLLTLSFSYLTPTILFSFNFKLTTEYFVQEGFYCPPGSRDGSLETNKCKNGTKCPEQSPTYISCRNGTYQPSEGKGSCLECLPGYYCSYQEALDESFLGVVNYKPCPAGFYCPESTEDPRPCAIGRYNPNIGKASEEDCIKCDEGSNEHVYLLLKRLSI